MTDCGPIETGVKHLFGSVVQAMMSLDRSIMASLENVNGFLVVYTSPDDLIRIDFEQEGVVPKLMLHIFEDFFPLLGRHSLNNKVPHMVLCKVDKPWGSLIGKDDRRLEDGSSAGLSLKLLYESSIEAGMTKKAIDTLDGSGMRKLSDDINFGFINLNLILGELMAEDDALFDHEMTFRLILTKIGSLSPSKTSIKALPVFRKDLPRIRGTQGSASKSTTTKSAEKWNFPTFTKKSSVTPIVQEIDQSASSRVIKVGVSSGSEILFHTDNGMRFMLAPRSARAKHSSILGKSQGMRNLSGPPVFLSTNWSNNGLNDGRNNGLRIWYQSFNLDNQRLDIFGASVISRMRHVLCHLGLTFYYFRKRRRR
nr:hypothetical protein [Tanacetum cinerariifolium]